MGLQRTKLSGRAAIPARRPKLAGTEMGTTPSAQQWLERIAAGERPFIAADESDTQRAILFRQLPFDTLLAALEHGSHRLDPTIEVALYRGWIDANAGLSPLLFAAWFNLGAALGRLGERDQAKAAYEAALSLRPDLHQAAINLGLIYENVGRPDLALDLWGRALQPNEARLALLVQRGRLLEASGKLDEAEQTLAAALAIDPAQPDVIHHLVHLRQRLCAWPATKSPVPELSASDMLAHSGPLGALALTDDIGIQSATAASWVERKTYPAPRRLAPAGGYGHSRIRVGYLSSDFCRHAMSYLIAELFERHDRASFEVFGYCATRDDGSPIRRRILAAFDRYRIVRDLDDEHAAAAIRRDEIDILIDLNGLTEGTRLSVLRWRPAPIQATYLGFVGAVPLPELDYLLCDDFVIPPGLAGRYSPKPLPIPQLYQANDSRREIGRPMARPAAGLPETGFVFCCFSRHYKITEDMFAAWMEILLASDNAVLWLAEDNAWSAANLRAAAARAGLAPDRLIFAERIDPALYMSRLALADLFLDTFPYNAGTVASDAMRMELPLLTLCGEAFASRMAGSLLHALGAPEGIATDRATYVATAIRLATQPAAYRRFRAAFTRAAWERSLGDAERFTRNFETTLASVALSPAGEIRARATP